MIQPEPRDLPKDNPLVSVEVLRYDIKRSKSKNKGIVPTKMEPVLEQTLQDENPARANIKQALGRSDTYAVNPVKEILHNLNLPDHRSVLTEPEVHAKMEMKRPRSSKVKFITTCSYSTDTSYDTMKAQVKVLNLPLL
ncbi:hypothetical protein Tco_0500080 [Tanacetum coccineum]